MEQLVDKLAAVDQRLAEEISHRLALESANQRLAEQLSRANQDILALQRLSSRSAPHSADETGAAQAAAEAAPAPCDASRPRAEAQAVRHSGVDAAGDQVSMFDLLQRHSSVAQDDADPLSLPQAADQSEQPPLDDQAEDSMQQAFAAFQAGVAEGAWPSAGFSPVGEDEAADEAAAAEDSCRSNPGSLPAPVQAPRHPLGTFLRETSLENIGWGARSPPRPVLRSKQSSFEPCSPPVPGTDTARNAIQGLLQKSRTPTSTQKRPVGQWVAPVTP